MRSLADEGSWNGILKRDPPCEKPLTGPVLSNTQEKIINFLTDQTCCIQSNDVKPRAVDNMKTGWEAIVVGNYCIQGVSIFPFLC